MSATSHVISSVPPPRPHAAKRFRAGTHRLVSPAETVARVRGLMPLLGITRIADVTGLDTIGIPVVMVCRPNARSLSVSQGKGLTLDAARASGLMESIEQYHAEHVTLPLKLGTWNELAFTHELIDVSRLPRLSVTELHANLRLFWVAGVDLLRDGVPRWVPFELVHLDYSLPFLATSGAFAMTSNGLASGNHMLEARLHAICELVERDASTLWQLSGPARRRRTRVDLATVDDPGCRELLDRYERAGIDVCVWETTSDVGVAAFTCTIVDREPNPNRPIAPMGGMGCHPSRAVALARALTEAAQCRLTVIAGVRDDVSHGRDLAGPLAAAERFLATIRGEPPARGFHDAPDHDGDSFESDLDWVLGRLREAGLGQVVAVDLTRPELGIPVVRVVIPGLESMSDLPGYVPGARARSRIQERDR